MGIHIIWPEDRIVPEDTILTHHADAIANGELPANSHTEDALKAAQELEHIGQITLAKHPQPKFEPDDPEFLSQINAALESRNKA